MSGLLLDTNAIIWTLSGSDKLGASARLAIDDATALSERGDRFEMSFLDQRRQWTLDQKAEAIFARVDTMGIVTHPISAAQAMLANRFRNAPRDPSDRLVMAAAIDLGLRLVTAEREILDWSGDLDRLDAKRWPRLNSPFQQPPRDHLRLDLRRALEDVEDADVAEDAGNLVLQRKTAAAVDWSRASLILNPSVNGVRRAAETGAPFNRVRDLFP